MVRFTKLQNEVSADLISYQQFRTVDSFVVVLSTCMMTVILNIHHSENVKFAMISG